MVTIDNWRTQLLFAAYDTAELKQLLLKLSADSNMQIYKILNTAFYYAITRHNVSAVRILLMNGANPNVQSARGITPLHCASIKGDYYCVKILLRAGANPNLQDKEGQTALYDISKRWHHDKGILHDNCVKLLLKAGANPTIPCKAGKTPIYWAKIGGYKECQKMLHNFSKMRINLPIITWVLSNPHGGPQINPWFLKVVIFKTQPRN